MDTEPIPAEETEIQTIKRLAREVISKIGRVNHAADTLNKNPTSKASYDWWGRAIGELHAAEDQLWDLLDQRHGSREAGLSDDLPQ